MSRAFIFDLDGTLLDSMGVWAQVDVDFLAKRGLPVPSDYCQAIAHLSFRETAEYTIARFGLKEEPEALLREWTAMAAHAYAHSVALKPHAKEYLLALKARGIRLGIATSAIADHYEPALARHGLLTLFDAICTTDQAAFGKTHPDVYLLTAQRLHVPPEACTVFEDIPQAIESAKKAGMTVYAILDEAAKAHWPRIRCLADAAFHDFHEAPLPKTDS